MSCCRTTARWPTRAAHTRPCIRRGLVLALVVLLAACAEPEPSLVQHVDLLAEFAHTTAARQRDRLDLGTPADDAALVRGWMPAPDDASVVWAADRQASIRLVLDEPRRRRLRLRCAAAASDGRTRLRSSVHASLNRRRIGVLRPDEAMQELELELPADAQRRGDNLLELDHALLVPASRARGSALPQRTVAYDWLELTTPDGAAPRARLDASAAEGRALVLPAGTRVDYFVRVPRAARLALGLEAAGPADVASEPSALRVEISRQGSAERRVVDARAHASGRRDVQIDLGMASGEIIGLSFVSTGRAELRAVEPMLLGPARPDDVATSLADRSLADSTASLPNVLIYVIDTLRADHLGIYGYPLPTSPRLDALAREGVVFDRAIAQSSWTKPAVASILTGRDPHVHGATEISSAIRPDVATLADLLAAGGYATAAFVTNVNVSAPFGFARGFESFVYLEEDQSRASPYVLSDVLGAEVSRWLAGREGRPFFLYVHASDPHAPYTAGAELRPRFRASPAVGDAIDGTELQRKFEDEWASLTPDEVAELVARYDAEIGFNDASLGALLDELRARGLDRSTLVVVTADHGEEFRDHDSFNHGHTLYDELIRVPLVIRLPGGAHAGERRATLARQIDLMPTVLSIARIAPPPDLPGRSLLGAPREKATGEPSDDEDAVEALSHTRLGRRDVSAIVTARWKVIDRLPSPPSGAELFDLVADPREQSSVAAERPVLLGYGLGRLAAITTASALDARPPASPPVLDAETEARLRALGYAE